MLPQSRLTIILIGALFPVGSEYGDWTLFSIAILAWVILAGAVALVLRAMYVLYTGVSGLSIEPFDKNSGTPSKTEAKLWV